jgi:hypothetical protein
MKKLLLIFFVIIVVTGCADRTKLPEGILPKQKMREVMWDMFRAGEYLNSFVYYKDSTIDKAALSQKWYDKIYALHKTSKAQFEKSYTYYEQHPVLMKELLDSLSRKQVTNPESYGQSSSGFADTTKKKTIQLNESRRKIIDSLGKMRLQRKPLNAQ